MRAWLATYDPNLPLLDVINDPEADDVAVRLAGVSLPAGFDSGYYDAEVLADAVTQLWDEGFHGIVADGSAARTELADLLEAGPGYTRALYDAVKFLAPETASRALHDHTKRMLDRADIARTVHAVASITI